LATALEEEIKRQRAAASLLAASGSGDDDSAPRYETKSAEYVGTGDDPIPKPVEEHYGDWKNWDTIEPLTAESVIAKPDDQSPKYETKSAEYVGTGDDWRKWPTIAEDQTGALPAPSADQPAPDTLSQVERATLVKPPAEAPDTLTQVERATLVKPPAEAPDTLNQVERAQLVKLPDNVPRGTLTTPVEPITPQEPTQAAPQVQRAELVPAPQPIGPKAPGASTQLAPPGKMDLRPDTEQVQGVGPSPTAQPAVQPMLDDWRTWITVDGTPAGPQPVPPQTPGGSDLAQARGRFTQELTDNPDLRRKLLASIQAEVGDQGEEAKLAYTESVMNRAIARGKTLDETISDSAYYPKTTTSKLGRQVSQSEYDYLNPVVSRALSGSNLANFATGNESGNVHSGGAPVTYNPKTGERFVLENPDAGWNKGISGAQAGPAKQPDWMSWPTLAPVEQTAAESAGLSRQRNALDDLNRKTENPGQFYKSLDQPIAGVTDANRKAYQENFKQELTKYAQNFYGEPDPDKAFQRAVGDANLGTFVQDIERSAYGTLGQFDVGLNKAYKDIDFKRLDQFAKVIHPESDGPGRAAFIKTITSIADPTVRAQTIGKIIAELEPAKQAALNSVDIADSADRVASPEYQAAQTKAIADKDAWVQKEMAADPTLKGTPGQWWSGQIGSFLTNAAVSTTAAPVRAAAFVAQLYGQARDRLKADHPDWTDDQVGTEAAKTSFLQQLPQEALMAALEGKMGLLLSWVSKAKNPIVRFGLGGGTHLAVGAGGGALQQIGANVGEGKPNILENVPQAALAGTLQAAPFAVHGGLHAAGAPGEQPVMGEHGGALRGPTDQTLEQPPPEPVLPQPQPVTAQSVLGPDVPDTSVPWYQPGPIVTRAAQRGAFSPEELRQAVAEMQQQGGTPEQIRAAMENLQPPPDWQRQHVYFNEQTMTPTAEERQAIAEGKPLPSVEPAPTTTEVRQPEITPAHTAVYNGLINQGMDANRARDFISRARGITQAEILTDVQTQMRREANGSAAPGNIGESEPWVAREARKTTASGIANKYTAERVASGDLPPIDPNVGVTTEELLARGARMGPEEVNQHVSDLVSGKGGDLRAQAAAIRTEEARLTQRSRYLGLKSDKNPGNQQLKIDAENAYKDLADFHQGAVRKMKDTFHVAGIGLQGEPSVDLSTFNGLREKFFKEVGQNPPPSTEPRLRKMADGVRKTYQGEHDAMTKLGNEIERQTARRKLPTAEETRLKAMEKMKDMPCPT
jgi:hypothetical protein